MFSASHGAARRLVTQVLSSGTWTAPSTTTQIEVASGYGASGNPATTQDVSTYVDTVIGQLSGSGATSGALAWETFQEDAPNIANAINGGSVNGGINGVRYTGYISSNTYDISLDYGIYADAIPGTAYSSFTSWKQRGAVQAGDSGRSYVNYTRNIAATTGAATTAFGQTFPGGSGGPASATTVNAIAVTPGAPYTISIPSGGSLTISYYQ